MLWEALAGIIVLAVIVAIFVGIIEIVKGISNNEK